MEYTTRVITYGDVGGHGIYTFAAQLLFPNGRKAFLQILPEATHPGVLVRGSARSEVAAMLEQLQPRPRIFLGLSEDFPMDLVQFERLDINPHLTREKYIRLASGTVMSEQLVNILFPE